MVHEGRTGPCHLGRTRSEEVARRAAGTQVPAALFCAYLLWLSKQLSPHRGRRALPHRGRRPQDRGKAKAAGRRTEAAAQRTEDRGQRTEAAAQRPHTRPGGPSSRPHCPWGGGPHPSHRQHFSTYLPNYTNRQHFPVGQKRSVRVRIANRLAGRTDSATIGPQ